jgi:hypothetical protein
MPAKAGIQTWPRVLIIFVPGAMGSDLITFNGVLPAIDRMVDVFGGILVVAASHPLLAPVVRRLMGPALET